MIVFFCLALCVGVYSLKLLKENTSENDYLSKERTTAVNGIFVLLVFISHVSTYIELSSGFDKPYVMIKDYLGQTVVLTFLFYSGFGIARSIEKKGMAYVKSLPYRRIFKVLLHTDIAVALYLCLNLIIGKSYDVKTILLSLISWRSIGNSDWYVFAILGLYIIVFASFAVCKANKYVGTALTMVLSLAFVVFQIKMGRNSWCYNTIVLFPAGMIYSLIKPKIDSLTLKNNITYFVCFAAVGALFVLSSMKRGDGIIFYSLWVLAFMAMILLFTMKVQLKNKALTFFGSHVFSIYILQRLPMILFSYLGLNKYKYLFVILCFAVTVGLSVVFDLLLGKLDSVLFKPRKAVVQK